jgi:hypothetical protein
MRGSEPYMYQCMHRRWDSTCIFADIDILYQYMHLYIYTQASKHPQKMETAHAHVQTYTHDIDTYICTCRREHQCILKQKGGITCAFATYINTHINTYINTYTPAYTHVHIGKRGEASDENDGGENVGPPADSDSEQNNSTHATAESSIEPSA